MLNNFISAVIGATLSLLLIVLPVGYYNGYFKEPLPVPYTVQEVDFGVSDDIIFITAGFNIPNEDCEFRTLDVFGNYLGEWFLVDWVDFEREEGQGDRVTGDHTLRVAATLDQVYDYLEIRTRHECIVDNPETEDIIEKEMIGKVFARIDLDGET